jgi:hypothetical protein
MTCDWSSQQSLILQDGLVIAHVLYLVVKRPRTCRMVIATSADPEPRRTDHTI